VDRHVEVWVYHRVTGDLSKSPKEQRMSLASIGLYLKQNIERLAGTLHHFIIHSLRGSDY
jgi:hypothetical protein